jgi:ABC-type multidrug transport system fused ATPase/permease subunit
VRIFRRCLADHRHLWWLWGPLLFVSGLLPLIVLMMPLVERRLIDEVIVPGRLELLWPTLAIYGLLWLISSACQVIGAVLRTAVGEQALVHLRSRLFEQCTRLSLAFSRQEHSGRTMALFVNDAPSIAGIFSSATIVVLSSAISVIAGALLMLSLNWQLAVVAGATPPLVALTAAFVTRPLRPASRRAQDKAAELNERLQENLSGLREILAFGQEGLRTSGLVTTLRELAALRMRVAFMETTIGTGQSLLSLAVTLAILGFGGYLVIQGSTTLGTLVAMRSLFGYVFQPAMQIAGTIANIQKSLGAADRLYGFLDQNPEVVERVGAESPCEPAGAVVFDRVSFAYQPDRPVLKDVSLTANAGEVIALVGPSGVGKTTLVSLIARFSDPTDGAILLDGTDLRRLSLRGLREQIGFVFQDTFLFAATIRENIAFGRAGASEDQITAALRAANAWEFIEQMPDGLDTFIGERGIRLSEGQKQRLAIARALLRDPRILILDEPTSSLDARSEHLLQAALDVLMRGRTTFVIAHRLATVRRADRIIVLDQGRVVEQGSHSDLMRSGGLYRDLFQLQFGPLNEPTATPSNQSADGLALMT